MLVRHGQASAGSADYDRLSPLGWRQATELGRHWARLGLVPDRVWVGPCRRQQETAQGVAEAAAGAGIWPSAEVLPLLDEHDGYQVFARSLGLLAETDIEARRALERVDRPLAGDRRLYYRVYRRTTRRWARGVLATPAGEPPLEGWPSFLRRIEAAVSRLTEESGEGETVIAFTSSGPVAAAVGQALGLADEAVMELSWEVRNASVSELWFTGEGLALHAFNSQLHLAAPGLESWI